MTKDVFCLTPDMKMDHALDVFQSGLFASAPVTQDNKIIGILSIEDLILALREGRMDANITEYMTKKLTVVQSYDPVVEALKTFS